MIRCNKQMWWPTIFSGWLLVTCPREQSHEPWKHTDENYCILFDDELAEWMNKQHALCVE